MTLQKSKKLLLLISLFFLLFSCEKSEPDKIISEDNLNNLVPTIFKTYSISEISIKQLFELPENNIIVYDKTSSYCPNESALIDSAVRHNIPVLIKGNAEALNELSPVTGSRLHTSGILLIHNDKKFGFSTIIIPDKYTNIHISAPEEKINISFNPDDIDTKYYIDSLSKVMGISIPDAESARKNARDSSTYYREEISRQLQYVQKKLSSSDTSIRHDNKPDAKKIIHEALLKRTVRKNSNATAISASVASNLIHYKYKHLEYHVLYRPAYGAEMEYVHHLNLAKGTLAGDNTEKLFISSYYAPSPGLTCHPALSNTILLNLISPIFHDGQYGDRILKKFGLSSSYPDDFQILEASPKSAMNQSSGSFSSGSSAQIKLRPFEPAKFMELGFSFSNSYSYSIPDYEFLYNARRNDGINGRSLSWSWEVASCYDGLYNNGDGITRNFVWRPTTKTDDFLFYPRNLFPQVMRQTNTPSSDFTVYKNFPGSNQIIPVQSKISFSYDRVLALVTYWFMGAGGTVSTSATTTNTSSWVNWNIDPSALR